MARRPADDEDDAPWLAAVEPDRSRGRGRDATHVSRGGLFWMIGLALLLLATIGVGLWYILSQPREDGSTAAAPVDPSDLPLIEAPGEPYKVRPADAGGMSVEGTDALIYGASEGGTPGGALDVEAVPEDPMARPGETSTATDPELPAAIPPAGSRDGPTDLLPPGVTRDPAPAAAPVPRPAPIAAEPTPKPVPLPRALRPLPPKPIVDPKTPVPAGTAALQLGAFSSSAAADAAWKGLSGRYGYLAGLKKVVVPVKRDGGTLYRLRAAGVADASAAADLCARLKVAGEECLVAP